MTVFTREFEVERKHIEEGRTFSEEALDATLRLINMWIIERIQVQWDGTGDAPQKMRVKVEVDVE